MNEDEERYLWDQSGEPDESIERLEGLLAPLRAKRELSLPKDVAEAAPTPAPRVPERRSTFGSKGRAVFGVAVLAAAAAGLLVLGRFAKPTVELALAKHLSPIETPSVCVLATPGAFPVLVEGGDAKCAGRRFVGRGYLRPGQAFETDATARASFEMPGLGHFQLGPNARLTVLRAGIVEEPRGGGSARNGTWGGETRLSLARGHLEAKVDAPPRVFLVETQAATAIDLGCAYALDVGDDGAGRLRVDKGYVALAGPSGESLVPVGSECAFRPGHGPGTPLSLTASTELRAAAERFDLAEGASGVDDVLAAATQNDTVTLFHLLRRTHDARVLAKLEAFVPPPASVRRAELLAGDASAMSAYRDALESRWFATPKAP